MADLRTSWDPVTTDEDGQPLEAGIPDSYKIYRPGESVPIATVAGDATSYTEAGVVVDPGVYTREVTAIVGPFESANRGVGSVTVVRPGDVVNIVVVISSK